MPMATIVVEAAVTATERPAIAAAAKLLADALDGAGVRAGIEVRWQDGLASLDADRAPTLAIASMQLELNRDDEPLPATEARWRERLATLVRVVPIVIVCTILRRAADPPRPAAERAPMSRIERIRRLDRMAIELSHDTGARVADVDCMVAHVGARRIGADHLLANAVAAEVAAWTIVRTVLAGGLDDLVPPEIQERARASLGEPWNLAKFVLLRLQRR
jgi:hypothetical protein